jgi:threonyl-tRNA synthetase
MENVFDLATKRHSLAHLLAQALQRFVDPLVQLGTWPRTDQGFYYDVLFSEGIVLSSDQLKELTKKIQYIAKEPQTYLLWRCPLEQGYEINALTRQTLKNELLDKFKAAGETEITYYLNVVPLNTLEHARDTLPGYKEMYTEVSDFMRFKKIIGDDQAVVYIDLCAGPHVETTKDLDPAGMVIEKLAGAYRQADENNVQMTRIYGLAFENKEALNAHLAMLEEAKKRDHRTLGQQLQLFTFNEDIWPGLPLRLPKGNIIKEELEKRAKEMEQKEWYQRVTTPLITKERLFHISEHLPHYKSSMYAPIEIEWENYYIKPMNCPFHHKVFETLQLSYKDLPLRLAEYGHCHRYEDSWSLMWLMRVRGMCMNDAHIYCRKSQAVEEFVNVIKLHQYYYSMLGIGENDYFMELALRNPENDKYHGDDSMRKEAEELMKQAMDISGVKYVVENDGAAFYGPKIDFQIKGVSWRVFTASTNQIDLFMPWKFNLSFTNEKWEKERPVCIHRAPLGTHERFIGFLIEHFAWAFPVWLAPIQVAVLTVSDTFMWYGQSIVDTCRQENLRVQFYDSAESLNKKIRNAELMKIPYMLIIGEKEVQDHTVSVRVYKTKEQFTLPTGEFVRKVTTEFKERSL